MAAPCQLVDDPKSQFVQTYVVKVGEDVASPVLGTWAASQGVLGAGAWSVVEVEEQVRRELYLVVTFRNAHRFKPRVDYIKESLLQLPTHPTVEWVRPLTRRLQRRFGWGDVCASEADVRQACKKGDVDELKALMPQAATVIEKADYAVLPTLFAALHGDVPQLEDCEHEFFQEGSPFQKVMGPCARGVPGGAPDSRTHVQPYTRCKKCKLVLCGRCAADSDEAQGHHQELQALLQEARRAPAPTYWQHPERPLPFYVIDQQKVADAEKLAWLTQELGADADLPSFATTFCSLFEDKLRGDIPQKAKALALYAQYAAEESEARGWRKESDLPPTELEAFQKVWGPAPRRCRECNKALPEDAPTKQLFCDMACKSAGKTVACIACAPLSVQLPGEDALALLRQMLGDGAELPVFAAAVRELLTERQAAMPQREAVLELYAQYVPERAEARAWKLDRDLPPRALEAFQAAYPVAPGTVVVRDGCRVCEKCGQGAETADIVARGLSPGLEETELGKSIKRSAGMLQVASNIWSFSTKNDPDHEPAWKKRRRS
jgi:hypothetical protein